MCNMSQNQTEMMKNFKTTAVFNGRFFESFGINPITASAWGNKVEDIVMVECEIADDQSIPPSPQYDPNVKKNDYWGYYDNAKQEFTLIYQKRFILGICFANGLDHMEEQGFGKAYRLNVKEIK